MDSKVERIVPGSVLRVGQTQGRPRSGGRKRRFQLDESAAESPPSQDPHGDEHHTDGEGRTVSGHEDNEAGVRLDLTA